MATAQRELAALEEVMGGRLGVYAVDTGSGTEVRHRADERFLMCSTAKVLVSSAVLQARSGQPGLLDRVIRYTPADLLAHSPTTAQHVSEGMTVAALCEAALTVSDNPAYNLLLPLVGEPEGLTAYLRTLGDTTSRCDRTEPTLNDTTPGDTRDTSTPAAYAATLRKLTVENALSAENRTQLLTWMRASTTGKDLIRAGLPPTWDVADKSGSGSQGEVNNAATIQPPGRAPWVIVLFTAPTKPGATTRPTLAEATRTIARALT
ncbi:class A beta-lactamase [Actinokineospora bangkokensis]|uniref:class A beta-lactamase n=1 Tax=Actinokineospora bangkokensis TaxID=1193682 RepID=UPI001300E148|nr:class A beta-lactamase [Actinokineospora bangkokensis]